VPRPNAPEVGAAPMSTPEGATILVSAGPWTPQAIYEKLKENGLDATIGTGLIVRVEDAYPPTRITSGIDHDNVSHRSVRRWTMWLYSWPGSDFSLMPDRMIAHEIGLLWVAHSFEGTARPWSEYLKIRGLAGDQRLDSSSMWKGEEILADDYRLLFGSPAAVEQNPSHMNPAIRDPRSVPGLQEFLIELTADPS
jgi:hypothetical protein